MAVRGRTAIYPVRIDQTPDAGAIVDYEHKEVHTGDNYLEDESPNVASKIPKSVAFYRAL